MGGSESPPTRSPNRKPIGLNRCCRAKSILKAFVAEQVAALE
jgi:hypothetical protein